MNQKRKNEDDTSNQTSPKRTSETGGKKRAVGERSVEKTASYRASSSCQDGRITDQVHTRDKLLTPENKNALLSAGKFFPKILCFGDSLTQNGYENGGWCNILAQSLVRRCDVLNRGFSGYTSRMANIIISNVLEYDDSPKGIIAFVIILLGSNDASIPALDNRGVPLEEYSANLREIVNKCVSHGISKKNIIIVSPPPVNVKDWGSYCKTQGFQQALRNDITGQYAEEAESLSKVLDIKNINLWKLMQKEKDWHKFFHDGLHFSKQGHQFLSSELLSNLEPFVESLPRIYPSWRDIDPINPQSAFT